MQEDPQYKQEEKRPLTLQDSGAAPPSAAPARAPGSNLCYVAFACGVAVLLGYDIGVMSGAIAVARSRPRAAMICS